MEVEYVVMSDVTINLSGARVNLSEEMSKTRGALAAARGSERRGSFAWYMTKAVAYSFFNSLIYLGSALTRGVYVGCSARNWECFQRKWTNCKNSFKCCVLSIRLLAKGLFAGIAAAHPHIVIRDPSPPQEPELEAPPTAQPPEQPRDSVAQAEFLTLLGDQSRQNDLRVHLEGQALGNLNREMIEQLLGDLEAQARLQAVLPSLEAQEREDANALVAQLFREPPLPQVVPEPLARLGDWEVQDDLLNLSPAQAQEDASSPIAQLAAQQQQLLEEGVRAASPEALLRGWLIANIHRLERIDLQRYLQRELADEGDRWQDEIIRMELARLKPFAAQVLFFSDGRVDIRDLPMNLPEEHRRNIQEILSSSLPPHWVEQKRNLDNARKIDIYRTRFTRRMNDLQPHLDNLEDIARVLDGYGSLVTAWNALNHEYRMGYFDSFEAFRRGVQRVLGRISQAEFNGNGDARSKLQIAARMSEGVNRGQGTIDEARQKLDEIANNHPEYDPAREDPPLAPELAAEIIQMGAGEEFGHQGMVDRINELCHNCLQALNDPRVAAEKWPQIRQYFEQDGPTAEGIPPLFAQVEAPVGG